MAIGHVEHQMVRLTPPLPTMSCGMTEETGERQPMPHPCD
jgi:hypothetical protein